MPKQIPDEEILEKAIEVIIQQGYTGATTRQMAAAAGITELTLFRRFENKKKLVLAALQQEIEKFQDEQIGFTGDLVVDLTRVVYFYQNMLRKRGRLIPVLLAEVPRQPDLMEVLQGPIHLIGIILEVIQRYQDTGQLCAGSPFAIVAGLLGPVMMMGIAGQIQADLVVSYPNPSDQVTLFLRGYGADAP